MKKLAQAKIKLLLLFLIAGILVLGISFLFVSCGSGPQEKTLIVDKGPYAVDFTVTPATVCDEYGCCKTPSLNYISLGKSIDSMAGIEFTVEGLVKRKTASLNGVVFSRMDISLTEDGIELLVSGSVPAFSMAFSNTVYTLSSGFTVPNDTWAHIAGVLVNADHSTVHAACGGAEAETPHMDIYVDGIFRDCASTNNNFPAEFPYKELIGQSFAGSGAPKFSGVIDEVRFWKRARTPYEINQCYSQALGVSGTCAVTTDLIGYWKLNEGSGSAIHDSSGTGNSGTKTYEYSLQDYYYFYYYGYGYGYCTFAGTVKESWDGGWVAGKF